MTLYTKTLGGQTVTWTGGGGYYATRDGTLLIQGSGFGSTPPTITAYTPAVTGSGFTIQNGAILNSRGYWEQSAYGLDGRSMDPAAAPVVPTALPVTLAVGDSFIIAKSHVAAIPPEWACTPYLGTNSRSVIENMLVVIAVPYNPDPAAYALVDADFGAQDIPLAPPALGNSYTSRVLRGLKTFEGDVDMTLLPKSVVRSTFTSSIPSISALAAVFAGFCGELYTGWSTDTGTPGREHPGYGSYLQGLVSQALVLLCSDHTIAEKKPLALALVQWGIHMAGAFIDGRKTINYSGGHCQGRKAAIMLAGYLLHQPLLQNPDTFLGLYLFEESDRYWLKDWWFNTGAATDWHVGWKFVGSDAYNPTNPQASGVLLSTDPSTWGNPAAPGHNTFAWCFQGYYGQTTGCRVGTSLAMQLLGLSREWSANGTIAVRQHMRPRPAGVDAAFAAASITPMFGQDYTISPGVSGFCAEAFTRYGI